MNLCIDVGNSTMVFGLFDKHQLIHRLTFSTIVKTADEYESLIAQQIARKKIDVNLIEKAIYSSVVPEVNIALKEAIKHLFKIDEFLFISPGIKTGVPIRIDNPNEVGNDLIADLVGGKTKYGYPLIIADLGTASKILVLDKSGSFITGLIMPGLKISAETLFEKASLLPKIALEAPNTVLAKNTFESMNAGILYGHADMILGLIKRIEKELGYQCKRILTGGNATPIKNIVKDDLIYDENLLIEGLNEIILKNVR